MKLSIEITKPEVIKMWQEYYHQRKKKFNASLIPEEVIVRAFEFFLVKKQEDFNEKISRMKAADVVYKTRERFCFYCQKQLTGSQMTVDHRIPIRRGGSLTDPKNFVPCCRECNLLKGILTDKEFNHLRKTGFYD